jgi:hypothetical protein
MSTAYKNTAACAQSILELLGPATGRKLGRSGRSPNLPDVILSDLLAESDYERLGESVRERVSETLRPHLRSLREGTRRRYDEAAGQLFSLEHVGVTDASTEAQLAEVYEIHYMRCIDEIRAILAKTVSRAPATLDSRNTRGGFGDVSSLPSLKLTIQQTLRILETAFSYTKSPLSTEIDHLSKLTSLEPHQVRPISPSSIRWHS